MTLGEMFEIEREKERNTPEFLALAERSYQESKRWWIERCRLKGIPHELETEPETLPQSEIARFRAKTAETMKNILSALTRKKNTKSPPKAKATSSRPSENIEVPEIPEFNSSDESEEKDETRPKLELRSRKDPSEKEEIESEDCEDEEDDEHEDEDKFEDEDLTRAIRERLRAFRYEMHREHEPAEEDFKEVRVEVTKEMTFTIPMNTKNEAEVRQSIKGLVEFIEDNLKLTVRKIIKIKGGPKIREAYEVLDDWYRERHIKRIQEQGIGRREKRARIHMIRSWPKGIHESEEPLDEIGYLIGSKGDLQQEKHQKVIQEIDDKKNY